MAGVDRQAFNIIGQRCCQAATAIGQGLLVQVTVKGSQVLVEELLLVSPV
jgi:hypothetical protein